MAKVTDLRINISENGEKIQFETPVNVTKEGIFTTTLPRNAVDEIEKYGLTLRTNRLGNPGYFEAKTLDELTMSVKKVCREALSRELVEDKMIITSLQQEQTPTEREIAEAHRYAEMIRERDKERIQQEQPKFNIGDLVVSRINPHLTYKILATNIPNELGKTDYRVEIFTDGKPGLLDEPHNIHLISSDKIEDWGELVQQEQPKVDLDKFTDKIETFQERYKYPEVVSIKGAMAFMARMFYQYPNVARQWYDSLPKATMD